MSVLSGSSSSGMRREGLKQPMSHLAHRAKGVRLQQYYAERIDGSDAASDTKDAAKDMGKDMAEAGKDAAKQQAVQTAKDSAMSVARVYQDFLSKITTAFGQRPVDLQSPELYDQLVAVLFPVAMLSWAHKAGVFEVRMLDDFIGQSWSG